MGDAPTCRLDTHRCKLSCDLDQLNFELQRGIWWDTPRWETTSAVAVVGRAHESGCLSNLHVDAPLIPRLNDAPHTAVERERTLSCIFRGPELLEGSIGIDDLAGAMHSYCVASLRLVKRTRPRVFVEAHLTVTLVPRLCSTDRV